MKTRESGMPEEAHWASFFQPENTLDHLRLARISGSVVEFGCGYGTFTIPAARRIDGKIYAIDIDRQMIESVTAKATASGLRNVQPLLRDFVNQGTGLPAESMAYALLFNILHAEESPVILAEARRILTPGGLLGIMHWNYDPATPRGPSMEIRPRPDDSFRLALDAGFQQVEPAIIDLPPYHYGIVLRKPAAD